MAGVQGANISRASEETRMGTTVASGSIEQVQTCTYPALFTNINDLLGLPDPEAAKALNERMLVFEHVQRYSFVERGMIIKAFESRSLWKHLTDPDTQQPFSCLTAWLSCSDFLGCRRTNFAAKKALTNLADVPPEKLLDIPATNIHVLTQLSTQVRNDPRVLEAARTLPLSKFEEKIEKDHPTQHFEARGPMRFNLGRSWARTVEETISYALEHDIAGTREEALLRMAETALHEWELDEELRNMPEDRVSA